MVCSLYFLIRQKNEYSQKNYNPNYSWAFLLSILAFIEGFIFIIFTFDLLHEHFESLEENRTYIDDL